MTPILESELQQAIIDFAHLCGWRVCHFRPAQNSRGGWRTPVSADGAGFPDLVLARGGGVIFRELKSQTGRISPEQEKWLTALGSLGGVWRPADWFSGAIDAALR